MPECLTYAFHKRLYAPPCGRCAACLAVAPIEPPYIPPPAIETTDDALSDLDGENDDAGGVELHHTGAGWYDIVDADGETIDRVRGREAAEARAAELVAD